MASALFLGSWAVLMGPMIYGKSAHDHPLAVCRLASYSKLFATTLRHLPSTLVVDPVAAASSVTHAPHARRNPDSIVC